MDSPEAVGDYRFVIDEEQAGERLDVFLSALFPERSRTFIKKLIDGGQVSLTSPDGASSGKRCKPGAAVRAGDTVLLSIPPDAPMDAEPEDIPLDIIYEDNDILIVNKPKGMVVHPAPGHLTGTLVNAALYHCGGSLSGIGGVLRPGIVHRIDKDTTGSVIICKNDAAHQAMAKQLKEHSITRIYHALVLGRMPSDEGTIDAPIGRSRADRKKMAITRDGSGKNAVTHYGVIEYFPADNISYIACRLETGRTHQIRVHTASMGHPVLGDSVYGGAAKTRFSLPEGQCLHAKTLNFIHPVTGETVETDAPLPEYFMRLLGLLR